MDLHSLARSYLRAGGYEVRREAGGFLDLVHPQATKGRPARLLVWSDASVLAPSRELTGAERAGREKRENALLATFREEMAAAPGAIGTYLVPGTAGLSAAFASRAAALLDGGGIRVPVQFFDSDYKADTAGGSRVRSVLGKVLDRAAGMRRVAQPFLIRRGLGPGDCVPGAADLVEHLDTALRDPGQGARLLIVDGSAGSGKTVAFNALLKAAFDEFKAAKARHLPGRRPIAFLPEHIRGEAIGYVDDILDAASEAEMAQAVEPEQLRWLLKHGFNMWMLDGLDEIYAGDNDVLAFLDAELADPQSQAQVLVCTRDSLLSSSDALRGFIERQLERGAAVEIYELAPWDRRAWTQMAWLELEQGRSGAESSGKVRQFVSALEGSATLADLARLPFYCAVMLETFKTGQGLPRDELELLGSIVDRMLAREHGKDIFRWEDFVDIDALAEAIEDMAVDQRVAVTDDTGTRAILSDALDGAGRSALIELIEALAHRHRRTPDTAGSPAGLAVDDLRNLYGRIYASSDLADPDVERLLTVLVQLAFFGPGRQAGAVDFTHHLLADYLAGRYAVRLLRLAVERQTPPASAGPHSALSDVVRRTAAFRQAVGTAPFAEGSLFHRTVAREIERDPALKDLVRTLQGVELGRANATAALRALAP